MYYPIQIPYLLSKDFAGKIRYEEISASDSNGFVICFWEMIPLSDSKLFTENIIAADACIDLVVSYDEQKIGFAGMSKTDFHFKIELPSYTFGARMMPGAFCQLTGFPATAAMDTFLPIETVWADFDKALFFSLPSKQAKEYFKEYLCGKTKGKTPDMFTALFDTLSENTCHTTAELYSRLNLSPRQCQRLFVKHYGITPKMALSVIRFQKCLAILTSPKSSPTDILNTVWYYDQSHFINDFKRNIGLTPLELIRAYRD